MTARAKERHEGAKKPRTPQTQGRPTSLTPEVTKVLTDARRAGLPLWQCAHFAGVSNSAFTEWRQRGDLDVAEKRLDTPFAILVQGLEKAKADMVAASLLRIQQAGRGGAVLEETTTTTTNADGSTTTTTKRKVAQPQWQADAWLNERTQPEDFGRTYQSVELSGKGGGPVQVANTWADLAKLAEGATPPKK